MSTNRQVILSERPRYAIPTANCFQLKEKSMPTPSEGQVLVQTVWLSLDPYLYSRVKRVSAQAEPIKLGSVMIGLAVGRVVESKHERFHKDELVYGVWDAWQEYALPEPSKLRRVDHRVKHPSYVLGALNVPGFAGYLALNDLSSAKAGETVLIGTATGSLGQIAGQIAKNLGCRVVGIVGGRDKCDLARDKIGYDDCVSYRDKKFTTKLAEACPDGVDVYLETIGGKVTQGVLPLLNMNARMVVCGMMSTLNESAAGKNALSADQLLNETINRRLSIKGLVTFDYFRDRFGAFQEEMIEWLNTGAVYPLEDVVEGLENAAAAFQGMYQGKNMGKLVVKVAD